MKSSLQIAALLFAALAGALGLWLQQMPPLMIGSYWQCDMMTLLTIMSAAAQFTVLLIANPSLNIRNEDVRPSK
jgi:hypothetical protein